MYLSKLVIAFVKKIVSVTYLQTLCQQLPLKSAAQITKYIFPNCKIYLSKFFLFKILIVFVKKMSFSHQTFCQQLPLKSGGDEDSF